VTCSEGNLLNQVILGYEMSLDVLPRPACVAHWKEHVLVRVDPSPCVIHGHRSTETA